MRRHRKPSAGILTDASVRHVAAAVAIVCGGALARTAPAASSVWTGGGADDHWSTGQNWNPAGAPASDGTADVTLSGTTKTASWIDLPWAVGSLTFGSSAGAFTLSGGPLTVGAGGIQNLSSSVQTLTAPVVLGADQVWATGATSAAGLLLNGAVDTDGHALTFTGSGTTLNGPVTGSGTLVVNVSPTATVLLRGANTYSGGTVIKQGALYIETANRLGAAGSPITFNGGQLNVASPMTLSHPITLASGGTVNLVGFSQSSVLTLSGDIQGPGGLRVHGTGGDAYLSLTGHNSYTGGTTVDQAILSGNSDSLTGNISMVNQYAVVEFQQYTKGIYAGNISGGGTVRMRGTGVLGLTGTVNAAGGIGLYGGVLELYNGGSNISASTGMGFVDPFASPVIQFVGGATFTRSNVGWGYAGGFSARDGNVTINLGGAAATFQLVPHCDLVFGSATANSVTEFQNAIFLGNDISSPTPTVRVNAGVGGDYAVLSGPISGSNWWMKNGRGTLVLTGANTFTGRLILSEGAIQATDGVALPAAARLQFAGGVLLGSGTSSFSRTVGTASGQVSWTTGGGGFAAAGGTLTVNLGGAGATQTWGATNFVPAGQPLVFGAARADAETVFVNPLSLGSASREVRVDAGMGGDFATLSGPLTGSGGGLKKTGAGTLRLTGDNTYTGGTTVTGGTLIVASDAALGSPAGHLSLSPTSGSATVRFTTGNPVIGGLSSSGAGASSVVLGDLAGSSPTTLTVGGSNASTSFAGAISDLAASDPNAGGGLTKVGTGTLTLSGTNAYTGPTRAGAGKVVLGPAAWGPVLDRAGGAVMAGGQMAFAYAGTGSPQATVLTLLRAGYAGGFAGTQLRNAAPDAYHGIGWTDSAAASQLTLLGTWYGDANLNGRIDADDFALIDQAVAKGLSGGWTGGDFNYDGSIDSADYLLLDTSAVASGALAPTAAFLASRESQFGPAYVSALVASVPEPPGIGTCLIAASALRRRRRS